jgi:hypothetical protein
MNRNIGLGLHLASTLAVALGAGAILAVATRSLAASPPVSSNPDTDAFRTGGAGAAITTQLNAATAQFQEITRVFRACYTGGGISNDGSGCADGTNGRLADFWVIQGILKDKNTDPNGLGVPNGPTLGQVTYRVSANGASTGIACARDPASPSGAPAPVGFLAPEGFDGIPNTADDAGGNGHFGVPGPGINPNTTAMSAPPLTNCNTKLETFEEVAGTLNSFLNGTNTNLCIVNYDLAPGDGSVKNDQAGAGLPGALTTVGTLSGNETTNLKLSCDTAVSAPPTGDFLPAQDPLKSAEVTGALIYKIAASRDTHAIGSNDTKVHLVLPQLEALFGDPASNSACTLGTIGAASTQSSQNATICTRKSGSGAREVFRLSFMANTEGTKNQSEDTSGVANGTITSCLQTKETGGLVTASKRVKVGNLITDQINCVDSFSGSFTYLDADRFDAGIYGVVLEGVDPDAAIAAPAGKTLKDLVKCGQYRFWGPLTSGVGPRNGGASDFITAHRAALKSASVYANAQAYLPVGKIGFVKAATDGAYSIAFVPTTCPGTPPAELSISASPTTAPP